MELVGCHDIPYRPSAPPDSFRTFDIHIPSHLLGPPHLQPSALSLVCFIHGGAWRSGDKDDYVTLAQNIAVSTGYPVAVPNYRLTPRELTPDNYLHHPAHAEDVLEFLEFVLSWDHGNGGRLPRKPSRLFLIGHSCSAHMLCTIFLGMQGDSDGVCPSDGLVRSIAAIIMSEGIYDIDLLLSSFPGYRAWFVENTFGRRDSFENVSAFKAAIIPGSQRIRWFILYSKGDTLIDERQSEDMYKFLREKSCLVSKSFDELEGEHDRILADPKYIDMVSRYIKGVEAL